MQKEKYAEPQSLTRVNSTVFTLIFDPKVVYEIWQKIKKTSAVSTTHWMVETQLCKLRGTSDTFVGRSYSEYFIDSMVFVN